jgi:hypothetical protein
LVGSRSIPGQPYLSSQNKGRRYESDKKDKEDNDRIFKVRTVHSGVQKNWLGYNSATIMPRKIQDKGVILASIGMNHEFTFHS